MSEWHSARRTENFPRGFIYVDSKRGVCRCLIRDVDQDSARIVFSEAAALPDIISLHIPQQNRTMRARVSWRRGDEIGLAFTETSGMPERNALMPERDELMERVAQVEGEILKLRSLLQKLKQGPAGDSRAHDSGVAA